MDRFASCVASADACDRFLNGRVNFLFAHRFNSGICAAATTDRSRLLEGLGTRIGVRLDTDVDDMNDHLLILRQLTSKGGLKPMTVIGCDVFDVSNNRIHTGIIRLGMRADQQDPGRVQHCCGSQRRKSRHLSVWSSRT